MNSPTQSCRLCLKTGDDFVNVFEAFQNTTIAAILSKYFWFEVLEHDGMPEWLCQICWVQTKTFYNFYKRVELRHGDFRWTIDLSRTEIKKERSDSPVLQPTVALTDFPINKEEISDFEDSNEVVNNFSTSDNYDHKDQAFDTKTCNDSADGSFERKGYSLLNQCELKELEIRIREFFNMTCQICNDVEFETLPELRKHYRKVHMSKGYTTCCGRKYFKRHEIVKHIRYHINPDAYRCDQCHKILKDENSLKIHIDNHIPLDSREFKCSLCVSSFNTKGQLKYHVQQKHTSKTGEKFPCDKCGKNFRSSLLMSRHIRQRHILAQEYVCEVCVRTFKNKHTLQYHIKLEHSSTPPPKSQCDVCGVWVKHLKLHRQSHNETKPLNCPICNKEVPTKPSLKYHIVYIHGEKRFPCTLCDKEFKSSKSLREHVAVHTGEDLYNCPYCEKKFKSNGNMYHHRKNVHLAEWKRDCPQRSTSTKVSAEVKT